MEMAINVFDYISEDERRNLAREAFRAGCERSTKENFERILSNAAYELVIREVNAAFDGNMGELVKERALSVIGKLSTFEVFKRPDAWDRESSAAYQHLQAAMRDAGPLVHQRVEEVIKALTLDDLRELISDRIADAVMDRLYAAKKATGATHDH